MNSEVFCNLVDRSRRCAGGVGYFSGVVFSLTNTRSEKKVFGRGHGLFKKTHDDLILTEANKTRSRWKLPSKYFLNTKGLFLNRMKWENEKESTIFYKGFGQEFILDIEKNPKVKKWAINLIQKHG